MIHKKALFTACLAALSLAESGICADPPERDSGLGPHDRWFPADPMQPAGQSRAGSDAPRPGPRATPGMIPVAPPPTPVAQPSTAVPAPFAPAERLKLSCEEACSQAPPRIIFALERGQIGRESRVELESGDSFEIQAYGEACPHSEGKDIAVGGESVPNGCVFVFVIPAARAAITGTRARHDLRCSAGKIGMSGFHCNESSSPSSSFTGDALSREP